MRGGARGSWRSRQGTVLLAVVDLDFKLMQERRHPWTVPRSELHFGKAFCVLCGNWIMGKHEWPLDTVRELLE